MPLPYGFMLAPDGSVSVDQEKATTVRTIYQQYLSGMSLKGIADLLFLAPWCGAAHLPKLFRGNEHQIFAVVIRQKAVDGFRRKIYNGFD